MMQHPEYIYWAAVCLVAWPCALFSRCAGILALTWAVGQILYVMGAPEPEAQMVLYCLATIAGLLAARTIAGRLIAALYLPLALLSALTVLAPLEVWWSIFAVAMVQVAIVPFSVNWSEVRAVVAAFKQRRHWDDTLYRMRGALCW